MQLYTAEKFTMTSDLPDQLPVARFETSLAGSILHTCPSCSKEFESKLLLKRHLLIHSQNGPFPCDYCGEEYDEKSLLRSHWRICENNKGNHMCTTCGQLFIDNDSLTKHQDMHDRAKRHRCANCSKAFSFKSDLRKHIIIHTGMRPYVCPICCKTFTRSTNLNKHQRLHSGYRPFSCSQCPKSFSCKGDLGRHEVIHSGLKPFSCAFCTLSFTRKDKLRKHERLHNRGVPLAFTCPACPATFSRREELTKHSQFTHFSPAMDGLLVYVSEFVKETNCTEGSEDLLKDSDLAATKNRDGVSVTEPSNSSSSSIRSSLDMVSTLTTLELSQPPSTPCFITFKSDNLLQKALSPTLLNCDDIIIDSNNVQVR